MYYILTSKVANDREDAILSGESAYLKRIECSFREGIDLPVEDIIIPINFYIEEYALRGTMTDHLNLNDINGPVFSVKVKMLFENIGIRNIQYFQLRLLDEFAGELPEINKSSKEKKYIEYNNFFIANMVGLVDCINHEHSIVEYFLPPELRNPDDPNDNFNNPFEGENLNEIDTIYKLVLDEGKIDDSKHIFRLKDHPNTLIFHESIVEAISKEKLSGFVFVPVEEYTDAIPDEDNTNEKEEEVEEEKAIEKPIQSAQTNIEVTNPNKESNTQVQEEVTERPKRRFFL